MLFVPAVLSAALLALVLAGYRSGWLLLASYAFLTLFFIACAGSSALLLQWFLLIPTAAVCLTAQCRFRTAVGWGVAATTAAWVVTLAVVVPQHRQVAELREQFPTESLTERLAYERDAQDRRIELAAPEPLAAPRDDRNGPAVDELRLREIEDWIQYGPSTGPAGGLRAWQRQSALASLAERHDEYVTRFIRTEGFGVVRRARMLPPRREYIEIPDIESIPQPPPSPLKPARSAEDDAGEQLQELAEVPEPDVYPPRSKLALFHSEGIVSFSNAAGFGHVPWRSAGGDRVRDLDRVIGFQPHAFRWLPQLELRPQADASRWQVQRLELVSLLKHDPAAAYVSENLPRMDELTDAPTRPLDAFEVGALERLRNGEDLVAAGSTNGIRMVGSIRAVRPCVECHTAGRGELLGAFSYRLRRDPPLEEPEPPPAETRTKGRVPVTLDWRWKPGARS